MISTNFRAKSSRAPDSLQVKERVDCNRPTDTSRTLASTKLLAGNRPLCPQRRPGALRIFPPRKVASWCSRQHRERGFGLIVRRTGIDPDGASSYPGSQKGVDVDAKSSFRRRAASTVSQGSPISDGLIKPLVAYALGSLLAATSKRSDQRNNSQIVHSYRSGLVPNATAARHSSAESSPISPGDAKDGDRGRAARAPWEIPWTGWKDILWRTYGQIGEDRLLAVAAGVVFYGLLALFPAVTAFVSLYGFFAQASSINEHLALVAGILPDGAVEIVQEQVTRIASKGEARLSLAFGLGLGLALWSANAGMKALIDALNVSYNEEEKRGFIKLNLVSLALTVGAIMAVLIAVGAVIVVPVVLSFLGLGGWFETSPQSAALACPTSLSDLRTCRPLSFWTEPRAPPLGVDFCRKPGSRSRLAYKLRPPVLVSGKLCRLRCHLRLARSRYRHDDVDVDFIDRDSVRS